MADGLTAMGAAGAGKAGVNRVCRGECLVARRLQDDGEHTDTVGNCGVGRHLGLIVTAAEVDRAVVAGDSVIELVLDHHLQEEAHAGLGALGTSKAKCVAAGLMLLLVPVMEAVTASVAVSVWLPAVCRVALKTPTLWSRWHRQARWRHRRCCSGPCPCSRRPGCQMDPAP